MCYINNVGDKKIMKEFKHYCKYCNKELIRNRYNGRLEDFTAFKNRKYCNRRCMANDYLKVGNTNQSYSVAHGTARNIFENNSFEYKCSLCGETNKKLDIHHIDGNYKNNNIENLEYLCRSCHMKQHRYKSVCKICGKPAKAKEFCDKHYQRFRKYGNPLYTKYKTSGK